jgi:cytoskeletal protein CcmA (bactofilin family)
VFSKAEEETVIAKNLKIEGTITAEGKVRIDGKLIGDLICTSLVISENAEIIGTITADTVVVDGGVQGPIKGGDVILKSYANVVGDIHHTALTIEKGAMFDGRSKPKADPDSETRKKLYNKKAESDKLKVVKTEHAA